MFITPLKHSFRLLAVLLLVSAALYGVLAWQVEKREQVTHLARLANFTARAADQFFDRYASGLSLLAADLRDRGALDHPQAAKALLQRFQRANPDIAALVVMDAGQRVLIRSMAEAVRMPGPGGQGIAAACRLDSMKDGFNIGRPIFGPVLKEWVIPLYYPIRDAQGRIRFILGASLPLSHQQAIWNHIDLPGNMVLGLVRNDGYRQSLWPARGDPAYLYGHRPRGPLLEAIQKNPGRKQGVYQGRVKGFGSWDRLGAYSRLSHHPLTAFVSVPISVVWQEWLDTVHVPFLLIALLFIGGFGVYRWNLSVHAALERERKNAQERLTHLAHYDTLTGLPNRTLLNDRLQQDLTHAERHGRRLALLFCDLDGFKPVNDTLGHEAGDRVLREVAQRLQSAVRDGDTVARVGGDEFVVILADMAEAADAVPLVQKMLQIFSPPFSPLGEDFFITCSIGVSVYPDDAQDARALLKNADLAMYQAKEQGKNRYQFFAAEMNRHALERLHLENDLRHALARRDLALYYQPRVDSRSGGVLGVEILLRWRHPDGQVLASPDFMPLLEKTGLVAELGDWILHNACTQARQWQQPGLPPLGLAVKLFACQLRENDLAARITAILEATRFPPALLELEISERVMLKSPAGHLDTLRAIKALGVRIAIADFGAGYSELAGVRDLPVDILHIDSALARKLSGTGPDAAITGAILDLAQALHLDVMAEGSGSPVPGASRWQHADDRMRSFRYGAPLSAEEMDVFLQARRDGQAVGSV